jgi:hypothetical protein
VAQPLSAARKIASRRRCHREGPRPRVGFLRWVVFIGVVSCCGGRLAESVKVANESSVPQLTGRK